MEKKKDNGVAGFTAKGRKILRSGYKRRKESVKNVANIGSGLLKRRKAVQDIWWFKNAASLLEKPVFFGILNKKKLSEDCKITCLKPTDNGVEEYQKFVLIRFTSNITCKSVHQSKIHC